MEIKSKIEEIIPLQVNNLPVSENNRLNCTQSSYSNSELSDFESYIKELDENKKNTAGEQNNLQVVIPQEKNTEALKTTAKPAEKEKTHLKINTIDDMKLFLRKKENLKSFDKDIRINLEHLKKEDIVFFRTCLENPSITLNNLNSQNFQVDIAVQNQNNQVSYKSLDVSKGLFNLIEKSFKAQKPIRFDFNGNSSVILKMNNDGKLIAEFVSNDKAMESILKSSIPGLKDRLDSEGITYEEITYKDNSKNNDKRQNKGGNQ